MHWHRNSGDAFNGAFAVAIGEGRSAVDAARFACATAALSVTKAGTAPSMPTRAEIDAFMG
jgi:ribokinase